MRKHIAILLIVAVCIPGVIFAQGVQVRSSLLEGAVSNHHTRISLVADVGSIVPGGRFTVGVRMNMDRGWHTYWKNSGEAGLPTQVLWTLPAGFSAGEIQWPFPEKFNEKGEVVTYGYQGEVLLLVSMTAPPSLQRGATVNLKADVTWLECERICVPGKGSAELRLSVSADEPVKANRELFEKYRSQVPQPLLPAGLSLLRKARAGMVELRLIPNKGNELLVIRDTLPDFYPEVSDDIVVGRTQVQATPQEATLTISVSSYDTVSGPLLFRGLLLYQLKSGKQMFGSIEVPLPGEFTSHTPSAGSTQQAPGLLDQSFMTEKIASTQQPLVVYILFAIVGGLLLNIMPCVLPVIALKVFGLVKMAGDAPRRVRELGWAFSLGILASFLVLALLVIILKSAGEAVGWGFQFQEPLFVIAMSTVVFAFGLNLFGVYEIRLPNAAVAGVGGVVEGQHKSGTGYAASFAEGVFATILATPCTAPFLGAALGFAFSQPPEIVLLIFASVAAGMALPYLILTARPAWTKFLPKPGAWMESAKQFMGFLMMATLIWLLYILGKQLGMEAVIWTSAFLLVVGVACWLVGRFATLTATRGRSYATWIVAVLIVAAGYWLILESLLDVRSIIAGVPSTTRSESTQEIRWQPFSLDQLEMHLKQNKTVFIDFTADWCLTCKVNEKTVMSDQKVVAKISGGEIVPIRADWTNRNPDITRLLAKFGRSGVPLYVIFPSGKPGEPIVLPEVITTGIVIDALDRATGMKPSASP